MEILKSLDNVILMDLWTNYQYSQKWDFMEDNVIEEEIEEFNKLFPMDYKKLDKITGILYEGIFGIYCSEAIWVRLFFINNKIDIKNFLINLEYLKNRNVWGEIEINGSTLMDNVDSPRIFLRFLNKINTYKIS